MNFILGVTGSISAYKAYDICRGLAKEGHAIIVVTTKGAEKFLKKKTFEYLGAKEVYSFDADFQASDSESILHIELSNWANKILVAPASANTVAKIAGGLSDDLLSSIILASRKKLLLYPAMNSKMLESPITQDNIKKIRTLLNAYLHPSQHGELACGELGFGKLAPVEEIVEMSPCIVDSSAQKKNFLITTGATISPIDSVRYVTNASSGRTGYEMAKEILSFGHELTLIAGKFAIKEIDFLENHPNATVIRTTTPKSMYEKVMELFPKSDVYISSAAIGDMEFEEVAGKIKKKGMGDSLRFKKSVDILAECLKIKESHQVVIGFAAESDLNEEVLLEKWNRKKVDVLIGTEVQGPNDRNQELQGFGTSSARYLVLKNGKEFNSSVLPKRDLYKEMLGRYLNA